MECVLKRDVFSSWLLITRKSLILPFCVAEELMSTSSSTTLLRIKWKTSSWDSTKVKMLWLKNLLSNSLKRRLRWPTFKNTSSLLLKVLSLLLPELDNFSSKLMRSKKCLSLNGSTNWTWESMFKDSPRRTYSLLKTLEISVSRMAELMIW